MRITPPNSRCHGVTKSGAQCANPKSLTSGDYCHQHAYQAADHIHTPAPESPFRAVHTEMLALTDISRSNYGVSPVTSEHVSSGSSGDFSGTDAHSDLSHDLTSTSARLVTVLLILALALWLLVVVADIDLSQTAR